MKTIETQSAKLKKYTTPCIEHIKIDHEIALSMQSLPPAGPGEGYGWVDEQKSLNNPYKNNI